MPWKPEHQLIAYNIKYKYHIKYTIKRYITFSNTYIFLYSIYTYIYPIAI